MKKRIIISIIVIMIFSFIYHSGYKLIKIPIFPVNESIWEHGKMIMLSFLSLSIVDKLYFKDESNILFNNFISSLVCIILDFVIFTPIFLYILKTKENMFVTIIIYILCIICSLVIKFYLMKYKKSHKLELLSIVGYTASMILFIILSYYPLELKIFYDFNKHIYGLGINSLKF